MTQFSNVKINAPLQELLFGKETGRETDLLLEIQRCPHQALLVNSEPKEKEQWVDDKMKTPTGKKRQKPIVEFWCQ